MTNVLASIGASGLVAFQRALNVTGNNIANAATEGYTRQRVLFNPLVGGTDSGATTGLGVVANNSSRIIDQFVEGQLRSALGANDQFSVYEDRARRIDSLLGNPDSGLSNVLLGFFSSIQRVVDDPTALANRQIMLTEAESLAERFRFISARLDEERLAVNGQIANSINEINQFTGAIATVNGQIASVSGSGGAVSVPNELLDQRDQLVRDLSQRMNVSVNPRSNGTLDISLADGQALVLGNRSFGMQVAALGADPQEFTVALEGPMGGLADVASVVTSGRLGGLLDVRKTIIDPAQRELGRIAVALASEFNEQHRMGQDLDGNPGADFFQVPNPVIVASPSNSATGAPVITFGDIGKLRSDNYTLTFSGGDWVLRRDRDGQAIANPEDVGLSVDLTSIGGVPAEGDFFLVRPTASAAGNIRTLIEDPREIAAALPVRGRADSANTGAGVVESLQVLTPDPNLQDSVTLTFAAGALVSGAQSFAYDPATDSTTVEINGWRLVVRGQPADGDQFTVSANTGATGDNGNALALSRLQTRDVFDAGVRTIEGSYNALVSDVASKTSQASVSAKVQGRFLDSARAQRESISGVNLDEEAANLLRYQQAYQAAAQVVALSNQLFETLLTATRR